MFSIFRTRSLDFRNVRRFSAQPKRNMTASFDKTMYYPAFLLVLLGSQVINVMNAQRKVEDLERRYTMKMEKMDEIIAKVRNGEPVDVEREMELVNKAFMRSGNAAYSVMGPSSVVGKMQKEQELVLKEDMDDLTEEKLAAMLGLNLKEPTEPQKDIKKEESKPSSTQDIKVNRSEIDQQMKIEKELLSYKLEPESHLIVETPGDYVDAAKDTAVKKFL